MKDKEMNIYNINKELTQVPPRHLAEFLLPADLQVTTFKTAKTNLVEIKLIKSKMSIKNAHKMLI